MKASANLVKTNANAVAHAAPSAMVVLLVHAPRRKKLLSVLLVTVIASVTPVLLVQIPVPALLAVVARIESGTD